MPWKLKCPGHQREWYHWTAMVLTWLTLLWHYWHWKPIVFVMPTLLSLEASEDVIITTNNAISDDRVGIMTTIGFKCNSQFHISHSGSLEHRHIDFQTTHNAHTPSARPRGRVSVVSSTGDLLPLMVWTISQYIFGCVITGADGVRAFPLRYMTQMENMSPQGDGLKCKLKCCQFAPYGSSLWKYCRP